MGSYYDKLRYQKDQYDCYTEKYDNRYTEKYDNRYTEKCDDHYKDQCEDYSWDKKRKNDYPTVNANVNCCDYKEDEEKEKDEEKKEKEKDEKKENVRESAFRAIKTVAQTILKTGEGVKVFFQTEQFDLANEYDPVTSTFIPKQHGIYSIIASVSFVPLGHPTGSILLQIRVNGNIVASNSEPTTIDGSASVSTTLQLQADDRVEVFFDSDNKGKIRAGSARNYFEGAQVE